ncbi:unnamed protein product [Urochloa decumbens]|uniref:ZCF37 n=1 Tax=Urochloa decumbens TaxID=240449 RepID=A0ABC9FYL2_9POAL
MREMVFCGTGSFKDVDKEEGAGAAGGGKPAAAAKVKKTSGKAKGKDNPYASRGLDKFSTVLSELESKREKILRRAGLDVDADHLMVRFVQSETKGWVPIVVKLPHEEEQAADAKKRQSKPGKPSSRSSTPPTEPASPREDHAKPAPVAAAAAAAAKVAVPVKKSKAGGVRWSLAWGRKVRPCHYWLLAMALLLLSLVVFGRVFAICCTSIWWYLVPILSGEETLCAARSPAAAKARDKLVVAPPPSHRKRNSSGAAHEVMSPRSHAHRKKG